MVIMITAKIKSKQSLWKNCLIMSWFNSVFESKCGFNLHTYDVHLHQYDLSQITGIKHTQTRLVDVL